MKQIMTLMIASLIGFATPALADHHKGSSVHFKNLKDGQTIPASFTIQFGIKGMDVAPAGTYAEGTGHHHLLIDTDLPNLSEPIPMDENHRHFGGGQTEVSIELAPGKHTLQLLLGDGNHVPHNPPVTSKRITVIVRD